ncbi:MAG: hypothetical protein ABW033_04300 [Acidimicrobiia bacterium]
MREVFLGLGFGAVFVGMLMAHGNWVVAWICVALLLLACLYRFALWAAAPYSKTAWRLASVETARMDVWKRRADAIGRVPIFGAFWRFCQRQSQPMVDAARTRVEQIEKGEQGK